MNGPTIRRAWNGSSRSTSLAPTRRRRGAMIRSTLTPPLCHRLAAHGRRLATSPSAASKETLTTRERDTQCLPTTSTRADRRASAGSSGASCRGRRPPMPPARWSTGRRRGTLSTVALDPAGYPFGSVVSYGLDERGDPLFVISALAEHTRNLGGDPGPACSSPSPTSPDTDPLARGRVTLVGDAAPVPDAEQAGGDRARGERASRPSPATPATATSGASASPSGPIRWVGGFGEMDWVDADAYAGADVDPVLPHRHGIAAHMNDDHADAGVLLCEQALGDAGHVGDDAPRRPLRLRVRRPPRRRRRPRHRPPRVLRAGDVERGRPPPRRRARARGPRAR